MTALAKNRSTVRVGDRSTVALLVVAVAAAKEIFQGSLVAIDASGNLVPADDDASLRIVGMAEQHVDNLDGSAGDLSCRVRTGVFQWANSAGVDAITAADIGNACYAVDDQTVARSSAGGTRPPAGIVVGVDSTDGVSVETHFGVAVPPTFTAVHLLAGADLSAVGKIAVKVNSSGKVVAAGAGEFAIGILQNAPVADAVAVVAVGGVALAKAGTGGVTAGQQVVPESDGELITAIGSYTKTDDAGAASDALKGPSIVGTALSTATAGNEFRVLVNPSGAIPTTATTT
jgi:hypothetical protein